MKRHILSRFFEASRRCHSSGSHQNTSSLRSLRPDQRQQAQVRARTRAGEQDLGVTEVHSVSGGSRTWPSVGARRSACPWEGRLSRPVGNLSRPLGIPSTQRYTVPRRSKRGWLGHASGWGSFVWCPASLDTSSHACLPKTLDAQPSEGLSLRQLVARRPRAAPWQPHIQRTGVSIRNDPGGKASVAPPPGPQVSSSRTQRGLARALVRAGAQAVAP